MNKKNLSALIGLCGAVGNNGKRENTSDYPMEAFDLWDKNQCLLKEQIYEEILRIIKTKSPDDVLPDIIYKAISYIGYDLKESSYKKLLEDMKLW